MISTAVISEDGLFRYQLSRAWDARLPMLVFIMLNPSTADESVDDPTIRRCISFAKSLGFGGIRVVNLYAYRATDPRALKAAGWPVGPENDKYIVEAVCDASMAVCAWGANARGQDRANDVLSLISLFCQPVALALTDDGIPKHPLYLRSDLQPFPI